MTRRYVAYVAAAYLLAVTLPVVAFAGTATTRNSAATTKSSILGKHSASAKAPATPKVDLNSASEATLAALPGVDNAMAEKIIAARPFKNSSQILSKGIVTKDEYSKIRNRITARQSTMEAKNASHQHDATKAPGSSEGTTK